MAVIPTPDQKQAASAATPPPDARVLLEALLADGGMLMQQINGICGESTALLREESCLALESAAVGTRWLVVSAIAAGTSWFSINVTAVALVMTLGLAWGYAALVVSLSNAALAWYAHELARRCLDDMRFIRIRRLLMQLLGKRLDMPTRSHT